MEIYKEILQQMKKFIQHKSLLNYTNGCWIGIAKKAIKY
jgi:hypothetical protein